MEEASMEIFDSYNFNPRLFFNEIYNSVDDLLDGAFAFFSQRAAVIAGFDGEADNCEEIARGTSALRDIAHAVLYNRLNMWEKYCLCHIFTVPEGFNAQEAAVTGSSAVLQDVLCDAELDNQLEILRDKLHAAGKESIKLKMELQALEKRSALLNECERSIKEATKLHKNFSAQGLLGEVEVIVPILHSKFKKLRKIIEESKSPQTYFEVKNQNLNVNAGLSTKLEDLQQALEFLKKFETSQ